MHCTATRDRQPSDAHTRAAWPRQGWRFALIGVASNLVLFLAYLALTRLGVDPKSAMSVLFVVGTLQTYLLNRAWTFAYQGAVRRSLARYVSAYGFAYTFNLVGLLVLVDHLGLRHAPVQAGMVLVVGAMLFVLQRCWVFADHSSSRG